MTAGGRRRGDVATTRNWPGVMGGVVVAVPPSAVIMVPVAVATVADPPARLTVGTVRHVVGGRRNVSGGRGIIAAFGGDLIGARDASRIVVHVAVVVDVNAAVLVPIISVGARVVGVADLIHRGDRVSPMTAHVHRAPGEAQRQQWNNEELWAHTGFPFGTWHVWLIDVR